MKKLLRGILLLVFLLALTATPAFAGADTYPYLTFQDSADFTIVAPRISYEDITARGLDSTYTKQVISDPQNITWTSSDEDVALVVPDFGATAYVIALSEGQAVITASYTCADNTVIECPANVVVERRNNPVNLVQDVDITIVGDPNGSGINISRTKTGANPVDVPLFSLTSIWPGIDDADVLSTDPTALHALLYTLEEEMDDDNFTWGDPGWDWDWVPNNVVVTSQGAYIQAIGGDQYGWHFTVNGVEPAYAASIYKVNDTAPVGFNFQ